jgi:hypothetical protein
MSLKEFLKPDSRKIAIFAVLFLISFFFFILYFSGFMLRDFREDCCNVQIASSNESCQFIISGSVPYGRAYYNKTPEEICNDYKLSQVLSIVIWVLILFVIPYVLSCLFVWIYDKVKKKK